MMTLPKELAKTLQEVYAASGLVAEAEQEASISVESAADTRFGDYQSNVAMVMAKALKKTGRDDDIIILKEDDHFMRHKKSREAVLRESEKLFAKHLK